VPAEIVRELEDSLVKEDKFTALLLNKIDQQDIPSLKELKQQFEDVKSQVEYEITAPKDTMWNYAWGSVFCLLREHVPYAYKFPSTYLNPILPSSLPLFQDLYKLDLARTYLLNDDLLQAKDLFTSIQSAKAKSHLCQLLVKLEERQRAKQVVKTLETYGK